jgi:excisionase family DNA binding protein
MTGPTDHARIETLSTRALSISEFCRRYGIGRTTAYAEIVAGRLRAIKVGQRTLITADDAEAWLAALPELNSRSSTESSRR